MLDKLTSDDFRPYLNQTFTIHLEPPPGLEVELVEVTDLGEPQPPPGLRRPFSLVFRSHDPATYLPQGIRRFEHPTMGMLDMFMTPIGPDQVGMRYEIIFG